MPRTANKLCTIPGLSSPAIARTLSTWILVFSSSGNESRLMFIDHATGLQRATIALEKFSYDRLLRLRATPDHRFALITWQHDFNEKPSLVEKWWPFPRRDYELWVLDTSSARALIQLQADSPCQLSDDGKTLVTWTMEDSDTIIRCWDVPGRPSRLWVLGIPALLGV